MINIAKLFSSPSIEVEWDDNVRQSLRPEYQNRTRDRIPIRLFDLLKGLGCVQPRRVSSSWLSSLMDYGYLLERIHDAPDLKLKITETREKLGSENLTDVSELMGVGLSVAVISQLYDVQASTIHKIIGVASRRPDWECLLRDNKTLIVESKGSTNSNTSNGQLHDAVRQKKTMPGDLSVATASLLKETDVSNMRVVDPPVVEGDVVDGNRRNILRAYHYSSVFSFLGEDILSLYFEKMAKRLSGDIRKGEMYDKEQMFNELKYNASSIRVNEDNYAGHLYGPIEGRYVFLGVDKKLLSYDGFTHYQDAGEDRQIDVDGNLFVVQSDGVLVVSINNADSFFQENRIASIEIGEDRITLTDLDSIRSNSFKRYIKYLLGKCDEGAKMSEDGSIKAIINGQSRDYFVYHVRNLKGPNATERRLEKISEFMGGRHGVLVTNLRMPPGALDFPCVSRDAFERIADGRGNQEVVKREFGQF